MRVEFWGFSALAIDHWDQANGMSVTLGWASLGRSRQRRLLRRMDRNGR